MPVSIRALCSIHLNTGSFHAAWRKGQQRWQHDLGVTACCVLMVLRCSEFLQRSKVFIPCLWVLFLADLLELHIIEVFVLCGRLCWDASMLSEVQCWMQFLSSHTHDKDPPLSIIVVLMYLENFFVGQPPYGKPCEAPLYFS